MLYVENIMVFCYLQLSNIDVNKGGLEKLIGSVLGSLSCLMWHRGFGPPLRFFPVEGIFPNELTWVLTPFPKNSFG